MRIQLICPLLSKTHLYIFYCKLRDNALAFCGLLRLSCYIVARERGNWFLRAIWPCFRHGTSIVSALQELIFSVFPAHCLLNIYFHWHTVIVPVYGFSVDIQYLYTTFNDLVRMIGMSATVTFAISLFFFLTFIYF